MCEFTKASGPGAADGATGIWLLAVTTLAVLDEDEVADVLGDRQVGSTSALSPGNARLH